MPGGGHVLDSYLMWMLMGSGTEGATLELSFCRKVMGLGWGAAVGGEENGLRSP